MIFLKVGEIEDAFQLNDSCFEAKYGFAKPSKDASIVTHCLKGGRASKAQKSLEELGFTNVKVYAGSFTDWKANGGDIVE